MLSVALSVVEGAKSKHPLCCLVCWRHVVPRQRRGGLSPFPTERLLISSIVKAGPGVLEAKESLESEDDRLHGSVARHMGFHAIFWFHH